MHLYAQQKELYWWRYACMCHLRSVLCVLSRHQYFTLRASEWTSTGALDLDMAASANQSHALPPAVAAVLKSHSGAEGSVDGATGLGWVFSKKDLYVWMYDEGRDAEVHVRTLPYSSTRRHFVSTALHEVRDMLSPILEHMQARHSRYMCGSKHF